MIAEQEPKDLFHRIAGLFGRPFEDADLHRGPASIYDLKPKEVVRMAEHDLGLSATKIRSSGVVYYEISRFGTLVHTLEKGQRIKDHFINNHVDAYRQVIATRGEELAQQAREEAVRRAQRPGQPDLETLQVERDYYGRNLIDRLFGREPYYVTCLTRSGKIIAIGIKARPHRAKHEAEKAISKGRYGS